MIITYINAAICLFIAIRIFTFNRINGTHKISFALLAWAIICSSSAIFIFSCFNFMERVHIAQTIMNALLLLCFLRTHGSVAKIYSSLNLSVNTIMNQQNNELGQKEINHDANR